MKATDNEIATLTLLTTQGGCSKERGCTTVAYSPDLDGLFRVEHGDLVSGTRLKTLDEAVGWIRWVHEYMEAHPRDWWTSRPSFSFRDTDP